MIPSAVWLILTIALVAGEAATVGLVCIWFAVGALGGLIVAFAGGGVWLQIVVFLLVSALSLALVRPAAAKLLHTGKTATNADRVIGKTAVVSETIDNVAGKGQVSIAGQIWTARSCADVIIPAGTQVEVKRIEGVKVFVETK